MKTFEEAKREMVVRVEKDNSENPLGIVENIGFMKALEFIYSDEDTKTVSLAKSLEIAKLSITLGGLK